MKALVFEEPRRANIRELDIPTIAADEVLLRSRNVGICHSDFELYEGRYIIPVSYPIRLNKTASGINDSENDYKTVRFRLRFGWEPPPSP